MFRLYRILLFLALVAGIVLFIEQKINPHSSGNRFSTNSFADMEGTSIDKLEYDTCLRALSCIERNDIHGFDKFYSHSSETSLTGTIHRMFFKNCSSWLKAALASGEKRIVHIDSVYAYTDDYGSRTDVNIEGQEKECITYISFIFPSASQSHCMTFEFTDRISTDHFINWWEEYI